MKTFSIFAVAVLLAMTASGWAGFGPAKSCGPAFDIQDPQLRAEFAALDSQRTAESAELCSMYRDAAAQPVR